MDTSLDQIVEQLQKQESVVADAVAELEKGLSEKQAELKRIRDGLKALGYKSSGGSKRKPAASKADVAEAIKAILDQNGPVEEEQLKKLVETAIVELGKSRMGLALRFKEALQDEQFIDSPAGYRLKQEEPAILTE